MLLILRVIFAVIVAIIGGYGLITKNFEFQSYMLFFLSLMMLVMGLEEFQKGRKVYVWISLVAFLFLLFVSLQGFFLSQLWESEVKEIDFFCKRHFLKVRNAFSY